jgi:hypothetical protein
MFMVMEAAHRDIFRASRIVGRIAKASFRRIPEINTEAYRRVLPVLAV